MIGKIFQLNANREEALESLREFSSRTGHPRYGGYKSGEAPWQQIRNKKLKLCDKCGK